MSAKENSRNCVRKSTNDSKKNPPPSYSTTLYIRDVRKIFEKNSKKHFQILRAKEIGAKSIKDSRKDLSSYLSMNTLYPRDAQKIFKKKKATSISKLRERKKSEENMLENQTTIQEKKPAS